MSGGNKRCAQGWMAVPGECRGVTWHDWHSCRRPPGHPAPCMCACGDRP